MRTICGWCGQLMKDGPLTPVSHGLCARCAMKLERGAR